MRWTSSARWKGGGRGGGGRIDSSLGHYFYKPLPLPIEDSCQAVTILIRDPPLTPSPAHSPLWSIFGAALSGKRVDGRGKRGVCAEFWCDNKKRASAAHAPLLARRFFSRPTSHRVRVRVRMRVRVRVRVRARVRVRVRVRLGGRRFFGDEGSQRRDHREGVLRRVC